MTKRERQRKIQRELERPMFVEEYESLEGDKNAVLRKMRKLSAKGWHLKAFGFSNGFQGGWYAVMTMKRAASYEVLDRLCRLA